MPFRQHPARIAINVLLASTAALAGSASSAYAQLSSARAEAEPATQQVRIKFPSITIDRDARQIRVECESLALKDAPLEFLCVTKGGPEHEAVLRTAAKPSHVHAGLLMLGLQPGSPAKYSPATNAWSAPFGPPLRISCEWTGADGKTIRVLAAALLRGTARNPDAKDRPTWAFAGSTVREADGAYLADLTGYLVTIVNFEHALIDVPRLASSANATLEWETNLDVAPPRGTPVTLVIEPVPGGAASAPTTTRATTMPADAPVGEATPETIDREIAAYRDRWRAAVAPHEAAVTDAARAHYAILTALRQRQQALVEEADRVQRLIDELERQYGDMTTPKPE